MWKAGECAQVATECAQLAMCRALTFPLMSQAEIVLYNSLVHLHGNILISLSHGPCTFGASEDETFHNSSFQRFIYISSPQLSDF